MSNGRKSSFRMRATDTIASAVAATGPVRSYGVARLTRDRLAWMDKVELRSYSAPAIAANAPSPMDARSPGPPMRRLPRIRLRQEGDEIFAVGVEV